MADFKFGDGIKTIILAGVGAIAYSAEKGQEIIGELVKKGEITMEQGKDLSSDLQRSFKESMGKRGIDIDEISEKVSKMSTDELAKIKEQLANAEKLVNEKLKKAEETANDVVDAAAEMVEDVVEKAGDAVEAVTEEIAEATAAEPAEEPAAEEPAEAAAEEPAEEPAEEEKKEEAAE